MPTNNITKFDDDPLKNIQVTEWTRFILAILANSRAITPKCFMGFGWLSNLAEIFCQHTFSQSFMIIQWKLLKLLSGQMLWTPPACPTDARVPIIQTYKKYGTSGHVCYRGDSCVEAVWFRKVSLYLPLSQMIIISKQKTHLNSCFVKLIQWYHPTVHTRSIDLLLVH